MYYMVYCFHVSQLRFFFLKKKYKKISQGLHITLLYYFKIRYTTIIDISRRRRGLLVVPPGRGGRGGETQYRNSMKELTTTSQCLQGVGSVGVRARSVPPIRPRLLNEQHFEQHYGILRLLRPPRTCSLRW